TKADCGVKTTNVAASECAAKTECCRAKAVAVAASDCSTKAACGDKAAPRATNVSWKTVSAGAPVAMPVFFYDCGAVAADCSVKVVNAANLTSGCSDAASGCSKDASTCTTTTNVADTECKQKTDGCEGDGKDGCCGSKGKCPGEQVASTN
ncbi:MAG: hypothetical protein EA376_00175, partial [Phycisphaeraceae bacterium]